MLKKITLLIIFTSCNLTQNLFKSQNSSPVKYQLENGLKLLVYQNDRLPIVSYYTAFNAGSIDEPLKKTGMAHLFEHLMFLGKDKYETTKGYNNAFTSFDHTVYLANFEKSILKDVIQMEAKRMTGLTLNNETIDNEKNVVYEEYRIRYENTDAGKMLLRTIDLVFKGTPYVNAPIGNMNDLKETTLTDITNFYKTFYAPNNAVIAVVGDVDPDEVYNLVKENYQHFPASDKIDEINKIKEKYDFNIAKPGRTINLKGNAETPLFSLIFPSYPLTKRESYIRTILTTILSGSPSSYLDQTYVLGNRPLLSSISMGPQDFKYIGMTILTGQMLNGKTVSAFKNKFDQDLTKICRQGINIREFEKSKNILLRDYYEELATNDGLALELVMGELNFNDYEHVFKEKDILESITLNEVQMDCQKLFQKGNYFLITIWNKN